MNFRLNNRRLPRKTHRGYKTWKTKLEGNKKAMKSESGRELQKLPDKKRSARNSSKSSCKLSKKQTRNIKSNYKSKPNRCP